MRLYNYSYAVTIALLVSFTAMAQQGYITKWKDNKKAATNITFDDNLAEHFTHALPELNSRNLTGTFFVISSTVNWLQAQSLVNSGHEVGSHSVTHPHLRQMDSAGIETELSQSLAAIQSNLTDTNLNSYVVKTIAWPYGEGGSSQIKDQLIRKIGRKYYAAARSAGINPKGYEGYIPWTTPIEFYMRTGTLPMDANRTAANLAAIADSAIKYNGWMPLMYHAIDNPSGYANVPLTLFGAHLDTLAARSHSLWITTFAQASVYHQMRAAATLTYNGQIANIAVYTLTDTLTADSIYNEALTLRIYSPNTNAVTQNGLPIIFEQQGDTIQFNVVPANQDIVVATGGSTGLTNHELGKVVSVRLTQSNGTLYVQTPKLSEANLQLYDMSGRTLINRPFNHQTNIYTHNFEAGLYIIRITAKNGKTAVHKIVIP